MAVHSTALLGKLEHRGGMVVVLNAPEEFRAMLNDWRAEGLPVGERRTPGSRFLLVFVRSRSEVERTAGSIVTCLAADGLLWVAYPRQESQRLHTDVRPEQGWQVMQRLGFTPAREVVLNEDWAAVRLRRDPT